MASELNDGYSVAQADNSRKLRAPRACEQPKSRFLCETECEDGRLLSDQGRGEENG